MTVTVAQPTSRLLRIRRIAGLGTAAAVMPYMLIKIAWMFGLFLPSEEMGEADWRAINATTAVLAAVGVLLALAFVRPWGERVPAWLIVLPVWVGTGLLVPMLVLAPVLGPAAMSRDEQAEASTDLWVYEQIFVMISLVGVGIGLPLALAGYARARWPEALSGPTDCGDAVGGTRALQRTVARLMAAGCCVLGVVKLFWAVGGTLGLDQGRLVHRDMWWHLLSASTGVWAFAGAWGLLVLTSGRGSKRFLPPMAASWISSGMLFSYGLYSLLTGLGTKRPSPESEIAHLLAGQAGMVLGVTMGMVILLVLHDRRRALGEGT
ncbi:hypothetical protein AMK21_14280 [Streptomyces sp. CB00316]|uniref:hypothetical protein n=1 Tax=unclassified Streptomyces TaxID=2593676 RepID=UPI00093B6851|nr:MULTISPECIES: hypothetical protein [unclassified Streptomyces]MBT2380616.1 hypothetical protein [Streptomyces sp. ISL-111]MBT2430523.1 hypothetical protein [Streptomyces sp. ISL-112]MBT2461810.1 hypothetical protein [Streptomyces sp. ISL-63]OKJ19543.1 hypothetical protein AMK21_14280 [Streptomyces sp. CB00316]